MALLQTKVDLANQEIERIVDELEKILDFIREGGAEWLLVDAAEHALYSDLGYADKDEFEDALKGPFLDFLNGLPTIELKTEGDGRVFMRQKAKILTGKQGRPCKLNFSICSRDDLHTLVLKAPNAVAAILEMEFEFGPENNKTVDTIYNLIGKAITQLSTHISVAQLSADHKEKIGDAVSQLEKLLDVTTPWTFEITDYSGQSEIAALPPERVGILYLDVPVGKSSAETQDTSSQDTSSQDTPKQETPKQDTPKSS